MYAQEIAASKYVELCLGVVVSPLLHKHTLSENFTNNFFLHTTHSSHDILSASLSLTATDQIVSAVAVYLLAPSIPYLFSRGGFGNPNMIFS